MNKIIKITALMLFAVVFVNCGRKTNDNIIVIECSKEEGQAMDMLLDLPEARNLVMLSRGIFEDENGTYCYILAGDDMETHFATHYHFHVYIKPKMEIKVLDVIEDTIISLEQWRKKREREKISVLVLPPREGMWKSLGLSPYIKKQLETALTMDSIFSLTKFPKELMSLGVYCGVFDKKYCSQVIEKVETDFIIMSNLTIEGSKTGNMNTDKWNARIRIYNVKANKQIDSELKVNNLNESEMENFIEYRTPYLKF